MKLLTRSRNRRFSNTPRNNTYVVQDLKSTNGTFVNNQSIHEVVLKPNDRIRAGQTVFVFVMERPKGLATLMGEVESSGKGLHTYIGELEQPKQ